MALVQRKLTVLHYRGPARGAAAGRTALAPPSGHRTSGPSRPPRAPRTENKFGPTGRTDGSGSKLERTVCFEQRPKSERSERNGTHRVRSGHGWKRPCRGTGAFVNKRLIQPVSVIAIRRLFIKERLYFQCIACLLKNGFIFNVSIVWNVSRNQHTPSRSKPDRAFIH